MENIAIEEVLKYTPSGDSSTSKLLFFVCLKLFDNAWLAERKNQSMLASIKALAERIDILVAALEDIQAGIDISPCIQVLVI